MIPRLFPADATTFTSIGTVLSDTISCEVVEERNGVFELEMVVATTTPYFDEIEEGMLIVAKPNHTQEPQAFEIYEISRPINEQVTIKAHHISYRQSFIPVKPFSCTGISATFDGLLSNSLEENPFTFTTDITNEESTYNQIEPSSLRSRLGGVQGSLLDVFGGEYEWDNFVTKLWLHRGTDNGVQLRLGKNITDIEQTVSFENVVTGVLPYWHDTDGNVQLYGDIQYSSMAENYASPRTIVLDLSEQFEEAPTLSQLNTAGQEYLSQEALGVAKTNIKVSFIDLADTVEYKDSPLERVNLCDTVEVVYPPLNISYKAKAIKVTFDVLNERTIEVEIGEAKSSISKTVSDIVGDVSSVVKTSSRMVSVVQKVDREIGEITQDIASVEEKVDNISVGATNLLVGTSAEWSDWYTPTADTQNYSIYAHWCYDLSSFKSGTELTVSYDLEFEGATAGSGGESHIYLQSCAYPNMDNSTGAVWNKIPFPTATKLILPLEDGIYHYSYTATIPDNTDYTDFARFMVNFRTDYWNGTGKVRIRFLMLEVGNIPTDWSPAPEDLENSITTTTRTLENKITSTAESTTQSMKDYVKEQVNGVTDAYEKYTSDKVSTAKGDMQKWTSETYDGRLDNIESDADELGKTVDGLDDTVNNASTGLKKRVITSETNIEDLTSRLELIENGVGKAFVYTKDGAKVMAIKNNVVQDDTYTLTDEYGNHYIINGNETGWGTSEEFGAQQLSLGEDSTSEQRWQFKRDSANRLNINWHS